MKTTTPTRCLGIFLILCLVATTAFMVTACSQADSPTEPISDGPTPDGGPDDPGDSDDPDDDGDPSDPSVTFGELQISLTDAPTDEICELVVYIANLRVKKDGKPAEVLNPTGGIGAYDLLQLEDVEIILGNFEVEQGLYQFIEMHLDESESHVIEKLNPDIDDTIDNCELDDTPLKIPSAKFKINGGPFEVDDLTKVLIDFDAENSLKKMPNGKGWQLKPVVSIDQIDP